MHLIKNTHFSKILTENGKFVRLSRGYGVGLLMLGHQYIFREEPCHDEGSREQEDHQVHMLDSDGKRELECLEYLNSVERDDVDYMIETIPIVKCKDEKLYGEYRTKRVILEIHDEIKRRWKWGGV